METHAAVGIAPGRLRRLRDIGLAGWVPVYTTGIALLGITVIGIALTDLPVDRPGLLLFMTMAAVAELASVELFANSRTRVSASSVVALASILVFGPLAGVIVEAANGIMSGVTTTFLQKEHVAGGRASWLQRSAFNVGMLALTAAVAGQVYVLTGGMVGNVRLASNVLPLVVASTAEVLTNVAILIGVIVLQTRRSPLDIWRQDLAWGAPINIAGGVLGAGILSLLYEAFGATGAVLLLLPLMAMTYSYRLYVNNMRKYVNQLEKLNHTLDDANLDLLETLGAVIDAHDLYTYGHSAQVAVYAAGLAEILKLQQEEREALVKAALLHDVGKVGIMDSIIGKQGPLTDEEYSIVKRHPGIGADIVGRMSGLQDIVPLVRHHHERWDGRGYPDGLKGEDIPLGARILAMADSLDALCSDRPYRPTRSFDDVLVEVVRCSGSQFDPKVVASFLALATEKGRDFFKNSATTVDRSVVIKGMGSGDIGTRYLKRSMIAAPRKP